ncbi:UDP-glycosyltransferase 74E2-like [Prunus yedoensis var. nudiflora]|uniref:UDP-glycosyltransferase 74E2-like n=1 Tax=Prunus yedoensis var. nudiflora TaxID=2094558 RepID=A0A314Z2P4_PRUYE|nr:UDP-glycosyltransferase 74E2-like [Prunus yedoensis var. nudiflora]
MSKILSELPISERAVAAWTMTIEAHARITDPIYGCISYILNLEQQVLNIQAQLNEAHVQLAHAVASVANPTEQAEMANPTEQAEMANPTEQARVANPAKFASLPEFSLTHTNNVDNEINNLNYHVSGSYENLVNIPTENVSDGWVNNEGTSSMSFLDMEWSFEDVDEVRLIPHRRLHPRQHKFKSSAKQNKVVGDTYCVCIKWLDLKKACTVVYVSFGSVANLEEKQMEELALGLKRSKTSFMWVVRESEIQKLPSNFEEQTSEKGLVVNWCPQLQALAHRAIGCFMTHCGWNSTLEALSLGVPMVATTVD